MAMNILNKLTIKHLKLNKKRTIVSIIGILLSTALMVGIGLICSSLRDYMLKETIAMYGSYHSKIYDVDLNRIYAVRNSEDVSYYYTEEVLGYAKYSGSDNEYKPYFTIVNVSNNYFNELKLKKGRFPLNDNEIVISSHVYEQGVFDYNVGDTITLSMGWRYLDDDILRNSMEYQEREILVPTTEKEYKIVGIVERSNCNFEDYSSSGFYLFTTGKTTNNNANIYLTFKNPVKASDLSYKLYINLGKYENESFNDLSINYALLSMYGDSGYNNFDRVVASTLLIVLTIIAVACIIVIYNSFAISVMERKKQFGLFASIGATKRQLRKTVLFEVLVVGSIGIVLGIISAYIGIGTVIYIINKLLSGVLEFNLKLVTYPLFIIIPIIFMLITIVISAIIPMKKASSVSPIEAIRQNDDIKINKRKIKTLKITEKLFGIEGVIALKNIKRNKKKYRITIVSLFISIVTFIAFYTYLDIGTRTTEYYIGNSEYGIVINYNYNDENSVKAVNEILKSDEVLEYVITEASYVNYKINDLNIYTKDYREFNDYLKNVSLDGISIVSLDDKAYKDYINELKVEYGSIIIGNKDSELDYSNGNRVVRNYSVFAGKNIDLELCDARKVHFIEEDGHFNNSDKINDACNYSLKNIYVTDKYPKLFDESLVMIVNYEVYDKLTKDLNLNITDDKEYIPFKSVMIKADKYTHLDEIGEYINDETTSNYYNIYEQTKLERNIVIVIKILFYGFIALVVLIGVTSVFNTITTSIMLRKKEFSILRSIGLSPKGFNKMINFESILFGLKSLLYGIPVGIILSLIISRSMSDIVDFNTVYIPYKAIIIAIFGVFTIVLITMWYSAIKVKRENILDAIREENI